MDLGNEVVYFADLILRFRFGNRAAIMFCEFHRMKLLVMCGMDFCKFSGNRLRDWSSSWTWGMNLCSLSIL